MATKKDLVEAQAFSRRRLTTAFVAGAPGGREVEPQRPWRAIIGGLAVTALVAVGGLVAGVLSPGLPSGWDDNRLVIAKKSGARYVAIKKTLYPVINTTSARLLIPADEFKVVTVNDDKIATTPRGAAIGILGAPDSLTPAGRLSRTGWVSCVAQSGAQRTVVGQRAVSTPATASAAVVRTADGLFVVTGGYRLPVKGDEAASVLRQLRLESVTPIPAPAAWTSLFPQGPTLGAFRIPDAGKARAGLPPGAVVGSVLAVKDSGTSTPRRYVVLGTGELALITPFAYALYQLGSGRTVGADIQVTPAEIAGLKTTDRQVVPAQWPEQIPQPLDAPPCATLTAGPNTLPSTALSTSTTVKATEGQVTEVEAGSGALVRSIGDNIINRGPVLVVDQTATAYSVVGGDDVLARLGYAKGDVVPVPQAWVGLFASGPVLSIAAAQNAVSTRK
ncbi:type VII secretion protein EccB [Phycicoccus sp. 3266]|uniref:type VII secretion protein EccB n=1 Tax=Phycicoccus sp. 3266 TaxID=2817751 RepID=UPI002862673E|nr:type VII secretion protein EccB [Phycicoccus sp. 3266]MDR6861849.1 type VII secretion protein EccB [Phycicoccus sp. 3266]